MFLYCRVVLILVKEIAEDLQLATCPCPRWGRSGLPWWASLAGGEENSHTIFIKDNIYIIGMAVAGLTSQGYTQESASM